MVISISAYLPNKEKNIHLNLKKKKKGIYYQFASIIHAKH